jgi:hypothetical protein
LPPGIVVVGAMVLLRPATPPTDCERWHAEWDQQTSLYLDTGIPVETVRNPIRVLSAQRPSSG